MSPTNIFQKTKRWIKFQAHQILPWLRGRFGYFGTTVYFPPGSWSFAMACEQGIYEWENVQLLRTLMRPGTWMFDVGANIGLMAVPVLSGVPESRVVSFEPSPNSAPWLKKTVWGSHYGERWRMVEKAASESRGHLEFTLSPQQASYFDGLVNTQRVGGGKRVQVQTTTLDAEWRALGRPEVAVIKIDVEGWETSVLKGAEELLLCQKPAVLLEWNAKNLKAARVNPGSLLALTKSIGYQVFTPQEFMPIHDELALQMQMLRGETFLLLAKEAAPTKVLC